MFATAALYTRDRFQTADAKTAHGLVRGPSRYRIVALVDSKGAGRDAGELLDGRARGIPTLARLEDLAAGGAVPKPDCVVIGVAISGGALPPEMKGELLGVLRHGIGIVNGLHELLGDDPDFADAARRAGALLLDVRRPKPRRELHFWTGAIRGVRAPRLAVLGTDCALGKRTTCQLLATALRAEGTKVELIYTGQTGWLQGVRHGFVLDATPNDFVSGELEHAIVSCEADLSPDLILLEGQSALRNPSGPCGAELLLSGEARAVILQHAPARTFFEDQEALENRIPPLEDEIALIASYGARVLAIALNHEGLRADELEDVRGAIEARTGLPTDYPLRGGVARLVRPLRTWLAERKTR